MNEYFPRISDRLINQSIITQSRMAAVTEFRNEMRQINGIMPVKHLAQRQAPPKQSVSKCRYL